MKKSLLLSLSLMLVGGNVFTAVPQQSLFSENLVHTFEEIDTDKLAAVKSVISEGDALSRALIYLDTVGELTESKVLSLINSRYNITGNDITSLDNLPIIELLKERKNVLVQEIAKEVIKNSLGSHFGNTATEDQAVSLAYAVSAVILLQGDNSKFAADAARLIGFVQGVFCTIAAPQLYKIYQYRNKIRSREAEMNQIDKIITQIEAFQTAVE